MSTFSPLSWFQAATSAPNCRTALSSSPSLDDAVRDVVHQVGRRGNADLALVFVSTGYASDLPRLLPMLQTSLHARHWIGCAGGGVVGTQPNGSASELEQVPALSVTLLSLAGAEIKTSILRPDQLPDLDGASQNWQDWVGIHPDDSRSQIVLIDPTCRSINDLISGLDYAYPRAEKIGGIAAPHNAPHGSLLIGNRVVTGAVVCSIGGDWFLDTVVAQGCRPIGPVFAIEQVQSNILLELNDGTTKASPVACLQRVLANLSEPEREQVRHSLFLGIERRDLQLPSAGVRGKGSAFLVRNLIGVDPINGAVAVAERMRAGQNVQFHLREAEASRQGALALLTQRMTEAAAPITFGLLMACFGRGQGLFGTPNGDINLARSLMPNLPVAGVFCNGEIGPVAGTTHLHGYTACWGLLRHAPVSKLNDP
ncbi:FIST N-terminal domain-containing protein [Synechococcus sp. M16CYN]|uniref:FIST signal transduction protein n=1 Tax=Synechococcus sp. M16CYN TaxID=3103139 RepID=UPI0032437928